MIHSSWVWLAWVLRTRSGIATLSDAIAAETAPRAMQTTAVTIERFTASAFFGGGTWPDDLSITEGIFVLSRGVASVKNEYSFSLW